MAGAGGRARPTMPKSNAGKRRRLHEAGADALNAERTEIFEKGYSGRCATQ